MMMPPDPRASGQIMKNSSSDSDFEALSWHDNIIYGLRFAVGDAARGDWRADLELDIDHIVEWVSEPQGQVRFRVAPATLTFHDVSDLRIAVEFGDSGHQTMMNELSIDAIFHEPVAEQKFGPDQIYYHWRIALNLPKNGEITFDASGLTQDLRSEPVLLNEQRFAPGERPG